jgi:hypothetical protein
MNQLGHFEENLLAELREVVAEQATASQPRRALPRRRLVLAAAGGGLLAAGLVVGLPAVNSDQNPAAYAVTTNDDGTVTVVVQRINNAEGADELQHELAAHGVVAEVHYAPPGKQCRDIAPRPERGEIHPNMAGVDMPYLGAPSSLGKENVIVIEPAVLDGRTVIVEILDDSLSPTSYLATFRLAVASGPVAPCVLVDAPR